MSSPQTATVHVALPWAWSWCPIHALPISRSPDLEDNRTRGYGHHPAPQWSEVAHAVVAAVSTAQQALTADLTKWATVALPFAVSPPALRVAQTWLGLGEAVRWSLGRRLLIGDGRHRLWACRDVAGVTALPLRLDTIATLHDALVDYGDEPYRARVAAAVLTDLADDQATLGARGELAAVNAVLIANLAVAERLLLRGTALMTGDHWSAINE